MKTLKLVNELLKPLLTSHHLEFDFGDFSLLFWYTPNTWALPIVIGGTKGCFGFCILCLDIAIDYR